MSKAGDDLARALEGMATVGKQLGILTEVLDERRRQIHELEYPPDHDDQHTYEEFAWIVSEYTNKITSSPPSEEKIREWFVKITAMGLSAVESFDRRNDQE